MKVYVDNEQKIRAVNSTDDTSLTELIINDETNPFKDWSEAKICCYKVTVSEGYVTMMTPYVDTRVVEQLDNLAKMSVPYKQTKTAYYGNTEVTFYDVPSGNVTVFIGGYSGSYSVERIENRLTVRFDALTKQADVTISVL